jgi:hypothetical protein
MATLIDYVGAAAIYSYGGHIKALLISTFTFIEII